MDTREALVYLRRLVLFLCFLFFLRRPPIIGPVAIFSAFLRDAVGGLGAAAAGAAAAGGVAAGGAAAGGVVGAL
jgi:hypothetical protein